MVTRPFAGVDLNQKRLEVDVWSDAVMCHVVETRPAGSSPGSAVRGLLQEFTDFDFPAAVESLETETHGCREELLSSLQKRDWYSDHGHVHNRFAEPANVPVSPSAQLGYALFREHGVKILLSLAAFSLPSAYAAHRGVTVLRGSGFLLNDPHRRLAETTQFVLQVLTPGGLAWNGKGTREARKVRLMHGALRYLLKNEISTGWDVGSLGEPINDEDTAGTLMAFAFLTLEGLRKLHVVVDAETQQAYLDIWCAVGRHLGVDADLLPCDIEEAKQLSESIKARQIELDQPNEAGQVMMAALLQFLHDCLPWPLYRLRSARRLPASLIRYFLKDEAPASVANADLRADRYALATYLGLPRTPLLDQLVRAAFFIEAWLQNYAVFRAANRWLQRARRARPEEVSFGLLQLSRPFSKRFLCRLRDFDRNRRAAAGHVASRGSFDFGGLDETWQIDRRAPFLGGRNLRR